jgi:thioredoxin reductase/NAD-dependent dihydropyrimidine dehydrogenase PreA subunit
MDHWTDSFFLLIPYVLAAGVVTAIYLALRRRSEKAAVAQREESRVQGLNEPPSLHPVVDPHRCIGSGGCVTACPEGALGIVQGKAVLVQAAACIGHGACKPACPVDAIRLVFGTEKRGIDIPELSPQFETNVPGLFIAGELGGMGLIRKAVEQGRQAMEAIKQRKAPDQAAEQLDVLIVGAGPAGLAAGLGALQHRLRYRLIEQEDSLGGAVYHYPRNKIAMTAPVVLPLVGTVKMGEIQKEKLLAFWSGVVQRTGLEVNYRERMESLAADGDGFVVTTHRGTLRARSVLLAIGRRGTPRKLDVPGEEAAKVVYKLVDAEQYRGQRVLVVGGGDSALEAALALAEQPGTTVTLSYRSEAFSRVKQKNRDRVQAEAEAGRLRLALSSTVQRIEADTVLLKTAQGEEPLPNDAVVVCAGGVLPTPLLQAAGVRFATKHGTD